MRTRLVPGFERVVWYGPGPQETYADRKNARVDVYDGTVDAQYFDYSQPQETGNKVALRWLALIDDRGHGLLAVGDPLLSGGALHYVAEDLDQANHRFELKRLDETVVHLDLAQRGVGGDDSWGALPHTAYRLEARRYAYRFRLRPFDAYGESPMALSKVRPLAP
jgi:beta-galactosidase